MTADRHNPRPGPATPLSRRRVARPLAGVFCVICAGALALADDIASPPDASITHNTADAAQPFAEQTWTLNSTQLLGSTVTFTANAFQHTASPAMKADCRLALRLLSADPLSGWVVVGTSDQTNTAGGDNSASVVATSVSTGNSQIGLTVTFQNTNFSRLPGGDYRTTVTATISSN